MTVETKTIHVCDECGKTQVNQPMAMKSMTIAECDRCGQKKEITHEENPGSKLMGREVYLNEVYDPETDTYLEEEEFWLDSECVEEFRRFMNKGQTTTTIV